VAWGADRRARSRALDHDRYRRWLAVCWRDHGLELNAEMVRLG
jgi:endonuclease YncB( thermonuclease family)